MIVKPLLVGEVNPWGADPAFALYPLPEHASGGRLAQILGMTAGEYLGAFDRVNLCDGRWSAREARERAEAIAVVQTSLNRTIILLGRMVAAAFGVAGYPALSRVRQFVLLPHPSGRCRAWNDSRAGTEARRLIREAVHDEELR